MTKRKVAQPDLIDLLLADYKKPEDLIGENGILKQLTNAIVERALQAELAAHLGHDKHEAVANDSGAGQSGLPGIGCEPPGREGIAGPVGGADRGGEVLATGRDQTQEPWGPGHLHCLRGRPQRLS